MDQEERQRLEGELEEVEREAAALRAQMRAVEDRSHALRLALAPFQVGDTARALRRVQGQRVLSDCLIRKVTPRFGMYQYAVSWRRQDGSWADRVQTIYGDGGLELVSRADPLEGTTSEAKTL